MAFGYAAVRIFAASGSASLYLTPAVGTYAPGQAVTVQVYTNTGTDPVNAVQADFTYPQAKLQFNSIDGSGSAFGLDVSSTGGNGSVSIIRSTPGGGAPQSGVKLISTVHFTALAAGSAALSFSNTSHVVRSTDNADILTSTTGASYTIAVASTPTPTPPPVHTPTPAPGHTATPKPTGSTSPSPTASVVAAGGSPSASPSSSASPSASASPVSSSHVATVPTTTIPKKTDVLGVKVAGIPVLVLAGIVVLLAAAGVVFFMAHSSAGQVSSNTDTPTTNPAPAEPASPPAQTPSSQPIMPQTPAEPSNPPAPGQPSGSPDQNQAPESQDKDQA